MSAVRLNERMSIVQWSFKRASVSARCPLDLYFFRPFRPGVLRKRVVRVSARARESISRCSNERESLLPALRNTRARASERVLIVDYSPRIQGGRLLFFLSSVTRRSALLPKTQRTRGDRERRREIITDRRTRLRSEKKQPFVLSVRLSVYPSGSFISRGTRESWPTQFFIVHVHPPGAPRAH